jgi:nucleoside-diphosphate-sugar epimerase
MSNKHIILGAGGAIGICLTKELLVNNEKIKLVSRNVKPADPVETQQADLTNFEQVKNVVEENSIVYLLPGLTYNLKVWQEQWPVIMNNSIEACETKNSKLLFFDNVYSYGRVTGKMKEDSPINPCSKKGEVRAALLELLNSEMKDNKIKALIARSADFYGPYSNSVSMLYIMVISKLMQNKKAQWVINADVKHSFTFTEDCGKALFLLSKNEEAFNQVWHLPTAGPALTGRQFIELISKKLKVEPKFFTLTKWMMGAAGLFDKTLKELYEMLYQYEFDYEFDSSKFHDYFNFNPVSYEIGIEKTIVFCENMKHS